MNLLINDRWKIFVIQEKFNAIFPYLKLEFFSTPQQHGRGEAVRSMKHSNKTLAECRTVHTKGGITVNPLMTAVELEQNFMDLYGLKIQLFRKSGKAWLETTITSSWTLEKQNREGEALSKNVN